jgi:hypothetical protein
MGKIIIRIERISISSETKDRNLMQNTYCNTIQKLENRRNLRVRLKPFDAFSEYD